MLGFSIVEPMSFRIGLLLLKLFQYSVLLSIMLTQMNLKSYDAYHNAFENF